VRSGLKAGERVVVNGLQHVRPGMPVNPQTEVANDSTAVSQEPAIAQR
jgi:hypothetical protein